MKFSESLKRVPLNHWLLAACVAVLAFGAGLFKLLLAAIVALALLVLLREIKSILSEANQG